MMTKKEFEMQIALGSLSINDKLKLARCKRTSKKILTMLSKDKDEYVRYWTAFNSNASMDTLKILSTDKDWGVRWNVASNRNTPIEVLKILSKDEDGVVRSSALKIVNK